MSIVCIGRGNTTLGMARIDAAGNVVSKQEATCEPDPEGGSVAVWTMDPETKEVTKGAQVYGDWDAAGYLDRVLELLGPTRALNVPNPKEIIARMCEKGVDLCDYCEKIPCRGCIVEEIKEELGF